MANTTNQDLCLALMRADTESEVIDLLKTAEYWGDATVWRPYGDEENNFSSIGNQQSEAVAALVEKLVNSVDARLMNACASAGIDPTSEAAPRSIRGAVARFFEDKSDVDEDLHGRISKWNDKKVTEEGRLLTLAATGNMPDAGQPSLTVADQGEGQEPDEFPNTFLSLQKSNKLRIHFVQGKFNMGSTGALQFCGGKHKLQLIVSRRNPELVDAAAPERASEWGFTVVRRETPTGGARSSQFTYLAPFGASPSAAGGVLSFAAESWPIFPQADADVRDAYHRESEYGSLVKLYEYEWSGTKSNIVSSGGGLLRRIDSGLPELALPIRVFECRPGYSGHSGSFATNVLGLAARVSRDRADKLEDGFPVGSLLNIGGSTVKVQIFAFKHGEARNYRTARQGIIFSLNGQSHATFSTDFFRRKSVGMSYLADSLFVSIDCSAIEGETREDLFMNSRDRLRDTALARQLESDLESLLKKDPSLKQLRNARRAKDLEEKLDDAKPLSEILQGLLRSSPALSELFLKGLQVASPFPPGSGTGDGAASTFHGKVYPSIYHFKGMEPDEHLSRGVNLGSQARIALETDAEDDYFVRDLDPGACRLMLQEDDGTFEEVEGWQVRGPRSGIDYLTIGELPAGTAVGEELTYRLDVTDPSRVEAFQNVMHVRVLPASDPTSGTTGRRPSAKNAGSGTGGGGTSLALPNIIPVEEAEWAQRGMTEKSALHIVHAGDEADGEGVRLYDFYVNVDNKYLRAAQKASKSDPKLLKAQFEYALVLIGMALLQDESSVVGAGSSDTDEDSDSGVTIEALVARSTEALGPILLPMIESLGSLSLADEAND